MKNKYVEMELHFNICSLKNQFLAAKGLNTSTSSIYFFSLNKNEITWKFKLISIKFFCVPDSHHHIWISWFQEMERAERMWMAWFLFCLWLKTTIWLQDDTASAVATTITYCVCLQLIYSIFRLNDFLPYHVVCSTEHVEWSILPHLLHLLWIWKIQLLTLPLMLLQ